MNRTEVGDRIKKLRENSNYTREELAEKAEILSKFLYEVEKGRKGLSADTLLKISRTLSCSYDYILTGEDVMFEKGDKAEQLLKQFKGRERIYIIRALTLMQEMYH